MGRRRRRPLDRRSGRLHRRRHGVVAREDHLLTELAKTFNGSDQAKVGDKCVFVRPRARRRAAARQLLSAGWADPSADGPRAGDLVAGGERLGRGRQPERLIDRGEAPIAEPAQAVHAHAARDRHAQAHGRGARVPGQAARLLRHHRPRQRSARAGRRSGIPSGARSGSGKTNPNFSTSGLNVHDRPVLRGHRQDPRPHRSRISPAPTSRRSRKSGRVGGRALRRHDADVPQQHVPGRPARHRAHATRPPSRSRRSRSSTTTPATPTASSIRARCPRPPRIPLVSIYPKEGHALLRQPALHPQRPWVSDEQKQGASAVP